MAEITPVEIIQVGLGLWFFGLIIGGITAMVITANPAISLLMTVVDIIAGGYVAIRVVEWVR